MAYFAQFDGDEINGKRYGIGEEIADSVDAGTLAFLVAGGRIASTPPAASSALPLAVAKPVAEQTREELIQTILAQGALRLADATDEELRYAIERDREEPSGLREALDSGTTGGDTASIGAAGTEGGSSTGGEGATGAPPPPAAPDSYDALKDKPLSRLTSAQLDTVAKAEEVEFDENVKTNDDRVAAIEAARKAKSSS
jgi:hypothetical protein